MIAVLDLGFGNVASVINMLNKAGISACVGDSKESIASVDGIILPGVGHFDTCMELVKKDPELLDLLEKKVLHEKIPFLGICIGMHMLFDSSAEGSESGLGWIAGHVKRFSFDDEKIKIPHMGWSELKLENKGGGLFEGSSISRFYFVHSYYAQCENSEELIATVQYGNKFFAAAVNRGNIYGVQFHPEKSHKFGLQLLTNFARVVNIYAQSHSSSTC